MIALHGPVVVSQQHQHVISPLIVPHRVVDLLVITQCHLQTDGGDWKVLARDPQEVALVHAWF